MPLDKLLMVVLAALLTVVLAWAAISDIRVRRIPNRAVLAVLILAAPWLYAAGSPASAIGAGLISLAACFALFCFRVFGAGDAKLFSSVALFAGLGDLPKFVIATALVGGLIALVSFASRPARAFVMLQMRGQGDFGRGIPYGVAIALGGALVLWSRVAGVGEIDLPLRVSSTRS